MKVVFLAGASELGGAERSLVDLLAGLRATYPSWTLTTVLPRSGPLEPELRALGVNTTVIAQPDSVARLGDAGVQSAEVGGGRRLFHSVASVARALGPTARYVARLRSELARQAPDVVHSNGAKLHFVSGAVAPATAAVVWHIRDFISPRPLLRRLLRLAAHRCEVAIANSDAVAADVSSVLPALRVERVYNAIDVDRFDPRGPSLDIDAAAGWPTASPNTVRVGLVGTFARWKGHEVFMQALAALPADLPVRGYIVGGPLYATDQSQYSFEELREAAARHRLLPHRLGFTGHVADPASAMRALDVVVHASTKPEPFGRVIVEAMAARRAILVASGGGAAEIIEAVPGAGYPPGDWQALAGRLTTLIGDPSAREQLAHAGHVVATRAFDRRRLPTEVARIYESVLRRDG